MGTGRARLGVLGEPFRFASAVGATPHTVQLLPRAAAVGCCSSYTQQLLPRVETKRLFCLGGAGFEVQNLFALVEAIADGRLLPRANTFKGCKDFYLEVKVRIWP